MWGVIPRHNKSRRSGEGKSRPDPLPTHRGSRRTRHLRRTPILAQEGDHHFQCRLLMEIFSGLSPQSNRGSGIDKITHLDYMLLLAAAELCSGEIQPISLRIHLDLLQWLSEFIGVRRLYVPRHQTPRGVQELEDSFGWSGVRGPAQFVAPDHEEGRRAEPEGLAPAVCVLWRRQAHLHNPSGDLDIPAVVGGMMCPRSGTQQMGIMGIPICQELSPFFDPTSFSAPLYLRRWLLSPSNLNGFDEPALPCSDDDGKSYIVSHLAQEVSRDC
jgi:hypothetical protein